MTGIEFVPLLALGLVIYTLTNFWKFLSNRDWNAAITLVVGWLTGVLSVWLVSETDWGASIGVGGAKTLDLLSFPEMLLVGLVVMSAGSGFYDLKRSFDGTDSAATPPLTRVHTPPPPPPVERPR